MSCFFLCLWLHLISFSYCPHILLPAVCKWDYWHKHSIGSHPHHYTLSSWRALLSACEVEAHPASLTNCSPTTVPILTHCCLTYSLVLGLSVHSRLLLELLLQFPPLCTLTLASGRGRGKGVIHHGCKMRDHRVDVGDGSSSMGCETREMDEMEIGQNMKWATITLKALIQKSSYTFGFLPQVLQWDCLSTNSHHSCEHWPMTVAQTHATMNSF